MEWIALVLAVGALLISIWALKRTGGLADIKAKVDALSSLGLTEMKKQVESIAESFREKTADILDRLEKKVRGEEKREEGDSIRREEEGPKGEG
ncbi:MAG: hypothetical protein FJ117_02490 [Deltaproteobacteria bacterium]|nr:hypothetical protein [Deltaproteobacteria bacterium]